MERKKISTGVQILYGLGVSYALVDQIFAQWVIYYYKPSAASGLKPFMTAGLVSMALMFSRLVDMITDPLVGYLSDKFDSKFGRRIPFIAVGAIPLALSTMGFFYPVKSGGIGSALYLGLIGALFFSFYTIVGAPYNALIPEIGATSEERLKLSTWQSIFRLLYTAIAMLLPGIVMKKFMDNGMSSENALRGAMGILSVLLVIGLIATVFGVHEKKYSTNMVKKEEKKNTKEVLKKVLANKDFKNYLIGLMLFFAGFNTVRALMNYYIEVILRWDKGHITIVSAVLFGVAALFFIPVNILSKKYGYRKVMLASLIFMAILMMGLVGGYIRDILLGLEPKDCDFCTDIPYERLKEIFSNWNPIEIGKSFGIIQIEFKNKKYEIAKLRVEKRF